MAADVKERPLTREEREKVLKAPWPTIHVYSGKSWSGGEHWSSRYTKGHHPLLFPDDEEIGHVAEED